MTKYTWNPVQSSVPAWTYTYSFGGGLANTLALQVDRGLAIVSPPGKVTDQTFTELEALGKPCCLVAPNAFHYMGLAPWRQRYPELPIFAPVQSIARIERLGKVQGLESLWNAQKLCGSSADWIDMPYFRTGELLLRWKSSEGWNWYLTDLLMNLPSLPKGLGGFVFRVTQSGPGLRPNALAAFAMQRSRKALHSWLREQLTATPPIQLVLAHGAAVAVQDPEREVGSLLTH